MRSRARSRSLSLARSASGKGWGVAATFLPGRSRILFVQREVQQQHVHARLAEQSELTAFDVRLHERTNVDLRGPSCARDASDLKERGGRRDVRIEAGPGACQEIDRHVSGGMVAARFGGQACDGVDE